jgi:hypothetical protein
MPLEKVGDEYIHSPTGSRWQTYQPEDSDIDRTFEFCVTTNRWYELL